ncbi:dienelactone hydrolase family protein [Dactylosporangium sp. NPDC049525]|uniref:dienelactone hydrolase family protein n=1 Tax=Dactylosporangium sp. NPDC049525 TaxID=3154730 RepID=UPI00342FD44C
MSDQQTPIPVESERINVSTASGEMWIYCARPAPGRRQGAEGRAVVVLQEAFGVNDHIQDVARRFADHGYLAFAPDLFHRTGTGTLAYDQHGEAMALIGALGPDAIVEDVQAVLDHLARAEDIPPARTAVVGFCFGGRAAFTAATAVKGLAATVVFYGPGIAAGPHAVLDRVADLDAPLMLHVGSEDPTIPPAQVEAIDAALAKSGIAYESYLYDAAGHAFACDARPSMYRSGPARLAWERTYSFLDRLLPTVV